MSENQGPSVLSWTGVVDIILFLAAAAWTLYVGAEVVEKGSSARDMLRILPAIAAFLYLNWRYNFVGTPKR